MPAQPQDPLGRSLALVDGDLVLERDDGTLTLAAVSGEANLLQALTLRVLTPLGSDRFNIAYGLDSRSIFTSGGGVRTIKDLIRLNLVRTLATDRRVQDVRDVLFMDDDEYRGTHGTSDEELRMARASRLWTADVMLRLVTGEEIVLPLEVTQ